jgi:hypothetical protein
MTVGERLRAMPLFVVLAYVADGPVPTGVYAVGAIAVGVTALLAMSRDGG